MITSIIVDDEIRSRQTLTIILTKYYPEVAIVGEAGNAADAYKLITQIKPQLLFLDISMPNEDGFELLKRFDNIPFAVIFITAYEQYALKAIKACALDFLLKPLNIEEVIAAVDKAKKNLAQMQDNSSIMQLLQNFNAKRMGSSKLAIPTKDGLDFITLEDIVRMEAESNYTVIFMTGGRKLVSTRHLKEYEDTLPADHFFRVHHSHIINLTHISTYHKGEGGYVKMQDGSVVDIAKRKKKDFLALFER
jgi:two-component system LytT family response regulator